MHHNQSISIFCTLENISVEKLITHLVEVSKKESTSASLVVIAELIKSYDSRKMLQQLEASAIHKLVNYVQEWKLNTTEEQVQLQTCIDVLMAFAE